MTQFINLECYLECCQYAHLFGLDPQNLVPHINALPLAYRDFCKGHLSQSFLPMPVVLNDRPRQLTQRNHELPKQRIGFPLQDHSSEQVFIVREANSLALRSLQARYIYANVYYYWSYVHQLQQFSTSAKKLVIYNLDSFTPGQMTPLTFENHPNAPYAIPIVDTRSLKQYDMLSLSQSYETVYDQIIESLAVEIINDLSLKFEYITTIENYIKKIGLFRQFKFNTSETIDLIIEIDDRFYVYKLRQSKLEDIVYNCLPLNALRSIINQNQGSYHFVLLSSYTKLNGVQQRLQNEFQSYLFIPDLNINNFCQIWEQKQNKSFPLFGQCLDRISFSVKRGGQDFEICLPEKTCYEGEQELIVYGQYEKNGITEQNFPLAKQEIDLPFSINGEPFINNDTEVEQIYKIENQYFDQTPNLDVKIRFCLKPGLAPKLEVLDNYDRIINSRLDDRQEVIIQNSDQLGFIPFQQIVEFRRRKSQQFINYVGLFDSYEINTSMERFINQINQTILNSKGNVYLLDQISRNALESIKKYSKNINGHNNGLEVYVLDSRNNNIGLNNFIYIYQRLNQNVTNFLKMAKQNLSIYGRAYTNIIQIFGKSFVFSDHIDLDFLYTASQISYPREHRNLHSIHLHNLARLAYTNTRRRYFFDLFNIRFQDQQKEFYKVDDYIWGYARILLWYINFDDSQSAIQIYHQHFENITLHCLNLNSNTSRNYLRDALICLIYLLTFREYDPTFVQKHSYFYNQAKQLCDRLRSTPIRSKKANVDISLNDFFEQLLDGSATQAQVGSMIEID